MSDAARQNLKVSREGIVLIKSFEGFRPRAIQRAEGGWIIGYGHTLSAREGASVSEADAELLLRYDLLPVETTVNDSVPGTLNQHQFDALVSFAFSVGVDRFAGSDVRQRLNAGAEGEAAEAIMGWPGSALPDIALRRRTAERALFMADPDAPVALADLLTAPLAPPAVIVPFQTPPVDTADEREAAPETVAPPTPVDPREAAVAALLGEPSARLVQDDAPDAPPTPSNDAPPVEVTPADPPSEVADTGPSIETVDSETPSAEPAELPVGDLTDPVPGKEADQPLTDAPATGDATETETPTAVDPDSAPKPPAEAPAWSATRYAPYAPSMVGPLPYLQSAAPQEPDVAPSAEPIDDAIVEINLAPVDDAPPVEMQPTPAPAALTPVEPMAFAAPVDPAPTAELILTPPEDAPEPALARPLWTAEQRDDSDATNGALFGEELTLTQGGGAIMRHEIEIEAPARFDWSETGPFIFMGGLGLVSFGAAMAAFRRAAEQSGGDELAIIGWVLALIGLACVGVSSVNLYRKFGLPGGD